MKQFSFCLVDHPDPLRLPEILIVISVLLIWCASIFIFIRHSELLRIRHRDLPYRSTIKSPLNSNHTAISKRNSDLISNHRARLSSTGALTPPRIDREKNNLEKFNGLERRSVSIPAVSKQQQKRQTRSFDLNSSSSVVKENEVQSNDQQQLLNPNDIPSDIKQSLLDLHQQCIENAAVIKPMISSSVTDMSRRKTMDSSPLAVPKRCVHESPV